MVLEGEKHLSWHFKDEEDFGGKEGKECTLAEGTGPAKAEKQESKWSFRHKQWLATRLPAPWSG